MVRKASWRKFNELRISRYRLVFYRERNVPSLFKAELVDHVQGTYCGEVYFHFSDEITIIANMSTLTSSELMKILSVIEDYLQRLREL